MTHSRGCARGNVQAAPFHPVPYLRDCATGRCPTATR